MPVTTMNWSELDWLGVLATVIAPAFWKVAVRWPDVALGPVSTKCHPTWSGVELHVAAAAAPELRVVPARVVVRAVDVRAKTAAGANIAAARRALTASHPAILNFRFIWSPVRDSASLPSCVG